VSPDGTVLIVADGMGGHEAGEVASAIAAGVLVRALGNLPSGEEQEPVLDIGTCLLGAFAEAHREIVAEAQRSSACRGMGTTAVVGLVRGSTLYTCHVGDVRCYLWGPDGLRQITQDHSEVGALLRAGRLTADEVRIHPRRNEILQALGLPGEVVPELHDVALRPGDRVLLCSDGLWETLADEDMDGILRAGGTVSEVARTLVARANEAGGTDNITVVLYDHAG
jgi:protein phosphatase